MPSSTACPACRRALPYQQTHGTCHGPSAPNTLSLCVPGVLRWPLQVEPLTINISVPACSIGEVPRDNGFLCQKCDPRSFSLWQVRWRRGLPAVLSQAMPCQTLHPLCPRAPICPTFAGSQRPFLQDTEPLVNCTYPAISDITCQPCPDGAECPGGAVVVPMQGYWQSAANSTFMNACPNPEACRDGDDDMQVGRAVCMPLQHVHTACLTYGAMCLVRTRETQWNETATPCSQPCRICWSRARSGGTRGRPTSTTQPTSTCEFVYRLCVIGRSQRNCRLGHLALHIHARHP